MWSVEWKFEEYTAELAMDPYGEDFYVVAIWDNMGEIPLTSYQGAKIEREILDSKAANAFFWSEYEAIND